MKSKLYIYYVSNSENSGKVWSI